MDGRKKLGTRERLEMKEVFRNSKPAENVKRGDTLRGKVYNIIDTGAFVLTDEGYIGFIHVHEQPHPLKKEMAVEGRVTYVRADGRVNLSLRPLKEYSRVTDAEILLEVLKKRKGAMPFTDNSPPEVIRDKFGISKSAFKRALGKLLKDGLVAEEEGWIVLKGEDLS
ncbi:S1 RNA-binding domain-containing protein [Phosphitispora fastidiosa]|uniref:S1 RNA-binding domain-containing protein n=1 Tax=Phosphitispora fastidiosa TaxID=2837202 RepID=UPI001E4350FB|nr:S1 RNA-binding domain-containing protein [Phosphitispora fastidiosa]MBU7005935.1 putative RNA-binding protein (virulence factor B family) [Phosphitispora fastidiosa]